MNTNRTLKQAFIDSKPAQEAWLAGKPIQLQDLRNDMPVWMNYDDNTGATPYFAAPFFIWRPKPEPEPEKVPFTQLTVPDAWFRLKGSHQMYRIYIAGLTAVHLGSQGYAYSFIAEHFEYSHDRINWKPCYELKNT